MSAHVATAAEPHAPIPAPSASVDHQSAALVDSNRPEPRAGGSTPRAGSPRPFGSSKPCAMSASRIPGRRGMGITSGTSKCSGKSGKSGSRISASLSPIHSQPSGSCAGGRFARGDLPRLSCVVCHALWRRPPKWSESAGMQAPSCSCNGVRLHQHEKRFSHRASHASTVRGGALKIRRRRPSSHPASSTASSASSTASSIMLPSTSMGTSCENKCRPSLR